MTAARVAGTLLAASADDRTLKYRLLPYGEQGRTNLGRVTASRGVLTIPDRLVANIQHDDKRPVATADRADIVETDQGLEASFHVLPTSTGDDLLAEARAGVRAGVSVEIEPVVIRDGRLVAGTLTGAGFVTAPAFPSAQLVAADAGDIPDDVQWSPPVEGETSTTSEDHIVVDGVEYVRKTTSTYTTETTRVDDEGDDTEEEGTVPENTEGATASATAPAGGLSAARAGAGQARTAGPTVPELTRLMADAHRAGGPKALMAALTDIVPANAVGIEQPQYVGELWDGVPYARRFVPLFNHADLTSYTVTGWKWVTKPTVAAYTGDKTAVPSGPVATEPVTISAERLAGGHDIDRKFRDFNDQEFYSAYFAAMAESYARMSDLAVVGDALGAATAITADAVPTDVSTALSYIIDGAMQMLSTLDVTPTFALVAPDLYKAMLKTPDEKGLEYLNEALGLSSGSMEGITILPTASAPIDGVLVGHRSAMTVHELGGSPIRVEAIDVANGGIDAGLFGYYATNVHDAQGLVAVTAGV